MSERIISFDSSDFNMDAVIKAEVQITNMIKSIKGEIPLNGLVDRIDSCIELVESIKQGELEKHKKILKLTYNN